MGEQQVTRVWYDGEFTILTTYSAQQVREAEQRVWKEAAALACEDCRHGIALRQREDGMWQHAIAVFEKGKKREEGWFGPSDCHEFRRRAQEVRKDS